MRRRRPARPQLLKAGLTRGCLREANSAAMPFVERLRTLSSVKKPGTSVRARTPSAVGPVAAAVTRLCRHASTRPPCLISAPQIAAARTRGAGAIEGLGLAQVTSGASA